MASEPAPIRPLRRIEYEKLVESGTFRGEKIELLYGALVPMSPIGPPHASSVQRLDALMHARLGSRIAIRIQLPFAARDLSEPEPDVALVPPGDYDEAHPAEASLIVEIAGSSLSQDRGTKARLYAECAVPEYWIVNLATRELEVHTEPSNGKYAAVSTLSRSDSVTLRAFRDVTFRVSDLIR